MSENKNACDNKTIIIFGGTGSLGKRLISRFMKNNKVFAYSRDEAKHWTIKNEISETQGSENVKFIVGDIRDKQRVYRTIQQIDPDIIIIAAALKQVDTCELSPMESILTNLLGTQNVVDSVYDIEMSTGKNRTVLFVSTDKACSPINVYGMCKAVSERLVTSMSNDTSISSRFIGVRYGNVLESRGSIIPLFKYQAENLSHLTVTNPDMTRFVMTLDESVNLIVNALKNAISGEIFIPRLPSMRIGDLAQIFCRKYDKSIKIIGLRPGEKMHEALINSSESVRCDMRSDIIAVSSALSPSHGTSFEYTSADDVMTIDQLENKLNSLGILDISLDKFVGRSIEEIVGVKK